MNDEMKGLMVHDNAAATKSGEMVISGRSTLSEVKGSNNSWTSALEDDECEEVAFNWETRRTATAGTKQRFEYACQAEIAQTYSWTKSAHYESTKDGGTSIDEDMPDVGSWVNDLAMTFNGMGGTKLSMLIEYVDGNTERLEILTRPNLQVANAGV